MKHANVSQLKAQLSAYLAMVRKGDSVMVYDRKTPIARVVPVEEPLNDLRIEEATHPAQELRALRPVRLRREVDVVKLLREERNQR